MKLTNYDLSAYLGIDLLTLTIYLSLFWSIFFVVSLILFILYLPKKAVVHTMTKEEAEKFCEGKILDKKSAKGISLLSGRKVWGARGKSGEIEITEEDLAKWYKEKNYRGLLLTAFFSLSFTFFIISIGFLLAVKVNVWPGFGSIGMGIIMLLMIAAMFSRSYKKSLLLPNVG